MGWNKNKRFINTTQDQPSPAVMFSVQPRSGCGQGGGLALASETPLRAGIWKTKAYLVWGTVARIIRRCDVCIMK